MKEKIKLDQIKEEKIKKLERLKELQAKRDSGMLTGTAAELSKQADKAT
jgi:hypothetical protein